MSCDHNKIIDYDYDSGIVVGDSTQEGQQAFAKASNNMLLFAPQLVIQALDNFRKEIRSSNPDRTIEGHDKLLADLLLEIRRDVGIHPTDDSSTFSPKLWASCAQRHPKESNCESSEGQSNDGNTQSSERLDHTLISEKKEPNTMAKVSRGGQGKTLYIELSIFPCGQADPIKNLTIS